MPKKRRPWVAPNPGQVVTYCEYCKDQTNHDKVGPNDLRCTECGSARLHKIQGFDAGLM